MLSIVVPVRNESENLKGVFEYFSKNLRDISYEVLIINDFSKEKFGYICFIFGLFFLA